MSNGSDAPQFSIITVVRDREAEILANLDSIEEQTYSRNVEHIIIDGASDDGALEVIRIKKFVATTTYSTRAPNLGFKAPYTLENALVKTVIREVGQQLQEP